MRAGILAVGVALGIVLLGQPAAAQDLTRYRTFEFGNSVATVAAGAGLLMVEAKTLHARPALLQDLEWRPSQWATGSSTASNDPVDKVVFSFYDDQLFRVVVDYGRSRTEGMTAADLIEAISSTYGTPAPRTATAPKSAPRADTTYGTPIARWGTGPNTVVLYRQATYGETFRLVLTGTAMDELARKAEAQSARLDEQDAPKREAARQKKEKDDGLAAAELARIANKKAFRP